MNKLKLSEKILIGFFLVSVVGLFITMGITPVGGWAASNPHHEQYIDYFCLFGAMTIAGLLLLVITDKDNK